MTLINQLYKTILDRRGSNPKTSYTACLLDSGSERIAKKLGEESVELVIEATKMSVSDELAPEAKQAFLGEAADLMYHYLVLLASLDISPTEVEQELKKRFEQSGIEEKKARNKKS